ncbi:thymopoietin a isoform X2 [Dicentrarchus labrax]|uniref:thymopoietin a isoform X2 n=1 Tax=Dicentrarchus labrax TaxID=13489 RepID=UPI0021F59789|nr:thymopoietin a isoform X2 [Dicentrarchus labrax]
MNGCCATYGYALKNIWTEVKANTNGDKRAISQTLVFSQSAGMCIPCVQRDQLMDEDDDDEEPVLQVKRRSRRSSHTAIVTEDLRPVLTDQVQLQSNRRLSHRRDSPARAEPPATSTRPFQEPEASIEPLRPAARSLPEERNPRPVARLSGPTRVNPLTFSPMCNISPIKRQECHWSLSDQFRSKPGGVSAAGEQCAPPDVPLHKRRQQKITSFLSTCSPVKTLGCMSTLSKDVFVRQVEKIAASEQPLKVEENEVLKELFPNDINSPTGITATCRRPIRGAAGRPLKSSDLWNDENSLFSPKITKTSSSSSHTETRTVNRVNSLPLSASFNSSTSTSSFSTSSSSSRHLAAAPPAGQTAAAHRSVSPWIKLFLLAIVAAFLFLVYQAMETNPSVPFGGSGTEVASDSTA